MPSYERRSSPFGDNVVETTRIEYKETIRIMESSSSSSSCIEEEDPLISDCGKDFYKKLTELKSRNEKRLTLMESRYRERHSLPSNEKGFGAYYDCCHCEKSTSSSDEESSFREEAALLKTKVNATKSSKPKISKRRFVAEKKRKTTFEPFSMTLRDEEKLKERKLLEEMKLNQEPPESEEEIDNNFKARAVPEHVTKPVFRNMVIKNPQRYINTEKYLGCGGTLKKSQSMGELKYFRAKPFPEQIFTNYAYEKMKEAEEYRIVRKEMRQKTLLNEASFPPRMRSELSSYKEKLKKSKEKEPKKRVKISTARNQHRVPDFDRLYEEFQRSMELKKLSSKPRTIIEPFSFDGKYPPRNFSSSALQSVPSIRRVKSASVIYPIRTSYDKEAGYRSTNTARLRELANQRKIEEMNREAKKRKREIRALEKRQKEFRLRPEWSKRLSKNMSTRDDIRIRKVQRLEEEKDRMLSYKTELENIYAKVNSRPPLFVRQSQLNARRKVDKVYNKALSREGITEEEILQFLSGKKRCKSVGSINDNLTPTGKGVSYSRCSLESSDLSESISLDNFEKDL